MVLAYNPRFELMYGWSVQDSYITDVALSRFCRSLANWLVLPISPPSFPPWSRAYTIQ